MGCCSRRLGCGLGLVVLSLAAPLAYISLTDEQYKVLASNAEPGRQALEPSARRTSSSAISAVLSFMAVKTELRTQAPQHTTVAPATSPIPHLVRPSLPPSHPPPLSSAVPVPEHLAEEISASAENFGTSHASASEAKSSSTLLPAYAFLMKNRKDEVGFAYLPAVHTLQEMMLHQGFAMDMRYLEDQFQLYGEVLLHRQKNVTPIVVYFIWFARELEKLPWEMHPAHALAGLGAYTILYQTEPWYPLLQKAYTAALALGAKEIWEYSYENLQHYDVPAGSPVIFRYMPPGCAKAMDYGVNLRANVRDEKHLAFLGNWANREPSVRLEYNLSGQLIPNGWHFAINTDALFRNYFERFPIQLNTHSRLNDMRTFESFRASQMLTNGACILSETSGSLDEEAFEGIVTFGSGANLTLKFHELRGNSSAIRECQEQSRRL
eukprot:CAMPEP_0178423740 /NCGR_PEP_ID=MMETSP0689_2-20121128/27843_1 /TAXON_ID=160604 /ORGANISM="Amphidinium massartii, Strain CS-259" /LENGTH=436 /DNA_ID=CAMNT_0020045341 /DNA_START=36 /DNA_END=1342 /DNA_ORIENTATION=-